MIDRLDEYLLDTLVEAAVLKEERINMFVDKILAHLKLEDDELESQVGESQEKKSSYHQVFMIWEVCVALCYCLTSQCVSIFTINEDKYNMRKMYRNRKIMMRSDIKLPQPFASWSNSL